MEPWRDILIAVIGGIVSVIVARIQAKQTATQKGNEAVSKAEVKAEQKAHDVLHNGVYRELRDKDTQQQRIIDEQARALVIMGRRIDDVLPVYIERDQLVGKLAKAERELRDCLAREVGRQ